MCNCAGTTQNESILFIDGAFNSTVSAAVFDVALFVLMGPARAAAILEEYPVPVPAPTDYKPALMTIATDGVFHCPIRNATRSIASNPARKSPTYIYRFDHIFSSNQYAWGTGWPFRACWDDVCHGADLPFLFRPNYPQYNITFTDNETALSSSMQYYWSTLAATGTIGSGDPAAPLHWPAYNMTTAPTLVYQTPSNQIVENDEASVCNFWDSVGYNYY
jgi:carboxylesterase type B